MKPLVDAFGTDDDILSFGALFICSSTCLHMLITNTANEQPNKLLTFIEIHILKVAATLFTLIKGAMENKGVEFEPQLTQILQCMFIIKRWASLNYECVPVAGKNKLLLHYINSMNIAEILCAILLLSIKPSRSLLSDTGFIKFDIELNKLKTSCLKLGNRIMKCFVSNKSRTKGAVHMYCKSLYNSMLSTLITICKKESDKLKSKLETNAEFITCCFEFFKYLTNCYSYHSILKKSKDILIVTIIMVLLKSAEQEIKMMTDDPENFVGLAIDTCTKQISRIPKTEAISLLEELCKHIDGYLSIIISFCCELIRYGSKKVSYTASTDFFSSLDLITATPKSILVETALLVLADIQYLILKNTSIYNFIENVMTNYLDELSKEGVEIVKCRLALLFRFYGEGIYENRIDSFEKMIKFLFNGIAEKEQVALALQCIDTIEYLINSEIFKNRLKPYLGELGEEICRMIMVVDIPAFYSLLIVFTDTYTELIEVQLLNILNSLVQRIIKELNTISPLSENYMLIDQCWNVMHAICDEVKFFPMYLDQIENILMPLLNYIMKPEEITFDEDIAEAIATLIDHRKSISMNIGNLLPYMINLFNRHKIIFDNLLQTFNSYIYYGYNSLSKENIECFIKIGLELLFSKEDIVEQSNTEGAILLQIILQNIDSKIMVDYVPVIVVNLVKRLTNKPNTDYLTRQIHNAILCSIINNPQLTLTKLEELSYTRQVFQGMVKGDNIKDKLAYDVKVFTIGLTILLLQEDLPKCLKASRGTILSAIVHTLTYQAKTIENTLLRKSRRKVQVEDVEYSDDEV